MITNKTLRLDRLSLNNFRCFDECTLDLHPKLTVLVAENGHGKTAVLDAIRIAIGPLVDTVSDIRKAADFDSTDVRLIYRENNTMNPAPSVAVVADGYIADQRIHWSRELKSDSSRSRTTTTGAEDIRRVAQHFLNITEVHNSAEGVYPSILPLVAFYGTERLWNGHHLLEKKRRLKFGYKGRVSGYFDCLSSSSSFTGFIDWYIAKMNEISDARFPTSSPTKLIAAVEKAMRIVLKPTGWCKLDWDSRQRLVIVVHPLHGRLPMSSLSDGVRTMVALVADIARRCAILNPHLGEKAAQKTPGLLLIDELDLHLHPGWQQQVVDLLRKAFPSMQIILSTHSPHVLSTVDMKSIRVIHLHNGHGVFETPRFQTRGVESADVLMAIMRINPVPQVKEARWLNAYRALIENGELEASNSQALRSKLTKHFGAMHPLMLDLDRLIRFQAFKRQRTR